MPPETLLELGVRHGIEDVPRTIEDVRRFFDFRDFAHFIEVYLTIVKVLREGADFSALAYGKGASWLGTTSVTRRSSSPRRCTPTVVSRPTRSSPGWRRGGSGH